MYTITLVTVSEGDKVLFLDREFIMGADPGAGDNTSDVDAMAKSLTEAIHGARLVEREYTPKAEDWSYSDIKDSLGFPDEDKRTLVGLIFIILMSVLSVLGAVNSFQTGEIYGYVFAFLVMFQSIANYPWLSMKLTKLLFGPRGS